MKATSSRRKLIVIVLLGLALVGGGVRYWAPNPSLARDMGTLLLVLWLPIIGNVVAFFVNRARARRHPSLAFEPGRPFAPHLLAQLTPAATAQPAAAYAPAADERCCTLVIASEGFTTRLAIPLADWLAAGHTQALELEFLRPTLAVPRFPPGTPFKVMAGSAVAGDGLVVRVPA
jgi:hypothetical protein